MKKNIAENKKNNWVPIRTELGTSERSDLTGRATERNHCGGFFVLYLRTFWILSFWFYKLSYLLLSSVNVLRLFQKIFKNYILLVLSIGEIILRTKSLSGNRSFRLSKRRDFSILFDVFMALRFVFLVYRYVLNYD